jgi:tRNA_anti-like
MSKKKIFLLVFCLVVVGSFLGYNYVMKAGARNLEKEESEFAVSGVQIFEDFSTNSESASKKYLNKAVEITGIVTTINQNVITLDGKVSCQLQVKSNVKLNTNVKVKGRVTGFDDLVEEVKLDQCLIVD